MLAAFVLRFFIIFGLGLLAFVTFLVATTLIWLMWLDSWRCGMCLSYPVGVYTLALLGLLIIVSLAFKRRGRRNLARLGHSNAKMVHRKLDCARRRRDRHPRDFIGLQLVVDRRVVVQPLVTPPLFVSISSSE